jgi:hypothetical protein
VLQANEPVGHLKAGDRDLLRARGRRCDFVGDGVLHRDHEFLRSCASLPDRCVRCGWAVDSDISASIVAALRQHFAVSDPESATDQSEGDPATSWEPSEQSPRRYRRVRPGPACHTVRWPTEGTLIEDEDHELSGRLDNLAGSRWLPTNGTQPSWHPARLTRRLGSVRLWRRVDCHLLDRLTTSPPHIASVAKKERGRG